MSSQSMFGGLFVCFCGWKTCTSEVVAEGQAQRHQALVLVTYIWAAKLIPTSSSSDYNDNLDT